MERRALAFRFDLLLFFWVKTEKIVLKVLETFITGQKSLGFRL